MAVRLFVGNLSYATTEVDLRTYFGTVAPPSQVVLPVDRETGRPRGFAFVEFQDRAHAEQAIQKFNGVAFNGRPLAVSEARAREDRGPGGPPRPGGFSGPRPAGSVGLGLVVSGARASIPRRRRHRAAVATSVPTPSRRVDRARRRARRKRNVRGGRSRRSSPAALSASTMTRTSATSRCRTSTTSRPASRKTKKKTPRSSADPGAAWLRPALLRIEIVDARHRRLAWTVNRKRNAQLLEFRID